MQLQSWVRFSPKITPDSAPLRAQPTFDGLCDDEEVPLICPTCQMLFRASMPAAAYVAWGCFRYFRLGASATRLRDTLKPHTLPTQDR
jgi:hypothetical protein